MSVWRTEEIMRLGICSLRCLWHQHRILITPVMDKSSLLHSLSSRLTQRSLTGIAVTPVRFYSQEKVHDDLSSLPITEVLSDDPISEPQKWLSHFSRQLQQCTSPSDVLDLTCKYAPTPRQQSLAISQMWFSARRMTEEQQRYELELMFQHPGLEPLLQDTIKNIGHLSNLDLAYSLYSMVKLGVPQRSRVIQTFLRSCQEKVNDFDEKELSILSSCLHLMENAPNVSALRDGIRLIAEGQLPKIQTVIALHSMMRLIGKSATPEFRRKLEEKALSMQDQFTLSNCQYMFSVMVTMDFHSKPLLKVCSNKIRENLPACSFLRLYKILVNSWELKYRDTEMLTDTSDYLASVINIWTNHQMILFLDIFKKLGFCPDAFMEAFAEKVIADPDSLTLRDVLCILKVYCTLNYDLQHRRQQFLDSLSSVVESYLPKMSKLQLLRAVHSLCLLNHFPPTPLELLLQENTLELFKAIPSKAISIKMNGLLRAVDLCLRLDRPLLPQPLAVPSSALADSPLPQQVGSKLPLHCLQEVLEGQAGAELEEAVMVENFYFIDAVITIPLPDQSSETEGGEESPAERSHRIALLVTLPHYLCFGTSRPRGRLAAKIRHLRILGYEPVMVQEQELQVLSPEGRTEFLRKLIFPEHHGSDTK